MSKPKRKKLFVDAGVQGTILRRILIYAVCCYLFLMLPLFILRAIEAPGSYVLQSLGELLKHYGYLLAIGIVLLPMITYDMLRLTNRVVGPVYRLRRELRRAVAGEAVQPLKVREGDFWPELVTLFNQLAENVHLNEQPSIKSGAADSATDEERDTVVAGI